jgi:hypothetical protein
MEDTTDHVANVVGAVAGLAVPYVAIAVTSLVTDAAGGAAIMKTLAVAGVGLGAPTGIAVIGVVGIGCYFGARKLFKRACAANTR